MLTLHSKLADSDSLHGELVLTWDQREKCRLRARLASGEEVAIFTPRGSVLRDGELLVGAEGKVVRVRAALEPTYAVRCDSAAALLRCAYHLGNRHTQVQLAPNLLRIRVDPVLREMVEGLGATVTEERAAFEPESGAYSSNGHGQGHAHGHGHEHGASLAPIPLRQKIHRPGDAP